MRVSRNKDIPAKDLKDLFESVGWGPIKDGELIHKALLNSTHVITIWSNNNELIGLIRCLSDEVLGANIDCFLVKQQHQGQGYGARLFAELTKDLNDIRYVSVATGNFYATKIFRLFGLKPTDRPYFYQKTNRGDSKCGN